MMLNLHDFWLVFVYESETPLIFKSEERARLCARKLHGCCGKVDPRSISNYGIIQITDTEELESPDRVV